jgi:KaiC/GvpD/RAD55 family RecA-like ATPase
VAKAKSVYSCTECGGQSPKWQGQCPHCEAWNTLVEAIAAPRPSRFQTIAGRQTSVRVLSTVEATSSPRFPTGLEEFDRVLGGGLVPGGVVLLGGDPGIGKSTLLLQAMAAIGATKKALYVTGEESVEQVALRAQRLGLLNAPVSLLAEVQLEAIIAAIGNEAPEVVVIDSIQTAYTEALTSAPGSVSQVRECAAQLTRLAKQRHVVVIFVGHVTKEGAIAGPRVLEHIVDTVLYFEGDTHSSFRLVRAIKNRFGASNELGVFAMTERGLARRRQSFGAVLVAAWRKRCRFGDRCNTRRLAPAARRNPGARRSGAGRDAEAPFGRASIRSDCRCSLRFCTGMAASRRPATMFSSMRSAACASTSRPPILRYCSRFNPRSPADRCRRRCWCSAKSDLPARCVRFSAARSGSAKRRSSASSRLSSPV